MDFYFDQIILGTRFTCAIFKDYIKISPLFIYNDPEYNDKFIILSDGIKKLYISLCKDGILIEGYELDNNINWLSEILQLKKKPNLISSDYTQGSYLIKNINLDKLFFAYLVMNNKLMSYYLTMAEFNISQRNNRFFFKFLSNEKLSKLDYISYLNLDNKKNNWGEITAKYTNIGEDLEIQIDRSEGENSIKKFIKQFNRLLTQCYTSKNIVKVKNIYKEKYKLKLKKKKAKKKSSKFLKDLYPDIFVTGYPTNCRSAIQPAILDVFPSGYDEKRILTYKKNGTVIYAVCDKPNLTGKIPADDSFKFPVLRKVAKTKNSKLPCCSKTKKLETKK